MLSRQELIEAIQLTGHEAQDLRQRADEVRRATVGDEVHLRAIIEFSSYCLRRCRYCGLRADNEGLVRYRIPPDEIVEAASHAYGLGFGTVVLQSGEDEWWTAERLADVVRRIKQETDLAVTLSVGERPRRDLEMWREAGADRYLVKHETADPALYAAMHPDSTLQQRRDFLLLAYELGYQVGSGCIVGLPGQTPEVLAQDLELLASVPVHMAGIGPLIPHPETPLADVPVGSAETTLNMMALARLLIPDIMLASTTALETVMVGGRKAGLMAGGNVIMPNLTPRRYASLYEIYPGKRAPKITVDDEVVRARAVIAEARRTISKGPGHSPRVTGGCPCPA